MRASSQTRSCVPLPWCTSKSTIATRSSPWASSACRAPITDVAEEAEAHRRRGLGVVARRAHRAEGVARPRRAMTMSTAAHHRAGARAARRSAIRPEEGVGVDRREARRRNARRERREMRAPDGRAAAARRPRAAPRRGPDRRIPRPRSAAAIACSRSTRSGCPGGFTCRRQSGWEISAVVIGARLGRGDREVQRRNRGGAGLAPDAARR